MDPHLSQQHCVRIQPIHLSISRHNVSVEHNYLLHDILFSCRKLRENTERVIPCQLSLHTAITIWVAHLSCQNNQLVLFCCSLCISQLISHTTITASTCSCKHNIQMVVAVKKLQEKNQAIVIWGTLHNYLGHIGKNTHTQKYIF